MELQTYLPPNAEECEVTLLAILLQYPHLLNEVSSMGISVQNFYFSRNQILYKELVQLIESKGTFDFAVFVTNLSQKKILDDCGGIEYIAGLLTKPVYQKNFHLLVEPILLTWQRRELMKLCSQIEGELREQSEKDDFLGIVKRLQDGCKDILENATDGTILQPLSAFNRELETNLQDMVDFHLGKKKENLLKISTGLCDLDSKLDGGFPLGQLSLIVGRPGMGKSTVGLAIAANAAISFDKRIGYFSLEMDAISIYKKLLLFANSPSTIKSPPISSRDLFGLGLSLEKLEFAIQGMVSLNEKEIYLNCGSRTTVEDIRLSLLQCNAKNIPLDLIVVDYIGLLGLSNYHQGDRRLLLSAAIQDLRRLAKEFNIAIVGLAQVKRQEGRGDKRPSLEDIKETGAYEEESSIILGLYRESYYKEGVEDKDKLDIFILKNRFGVMGPEEKVSCWFEPEHCRMLNMAM